MADAFQESPPCSLTLSRLDADGVCQRCGSVAREHDNWPPNVAQRKAAKAAARDDRWLTDVLEQMREVEAKWGPFASHHEMHSVLREEVEELWDAIKGDESDARIRAELVDVAVVALRMLRQMGRVVPEAVEEAAPVPAYDANGAEVVP